MYFNLKKNKNVNCWQE